MLFQMSYAGNMGTSFFHAHNPSYTQKCDMLFCLSECACVYVCAYVCSYMCMYIHIFPDSNSTPALHNNYST